MKRKAERAAKRSKGETVEKEAAPSVLNPPSVVPRGRPTKYTAEIADEICRRLADGQTLPRICADPRMPARSTVIQWVIEDREGFSDSYRASRELQRDAWADDMVDISDDGRNDYRMKVTRGGEEIEVFDRDNVERSKVRVSTRQWLMKVGSPQKYGDKIEQTHKGGEAFLGLFQMMTAGKAK